MSSRCGFDGIIGEGIVLFWPFCAALEEDQRLILKASSEIKEFRHISALMLKARSNDSVEGISEDASITWSFPVFVSVVVTYPTRRSEEEDPAASIFLQLQK